MKSLLFQEGATPFTEPENCGIGRDEVPMQIRKNGRLYTFIARDRVLPEDPYLIMLKASAFSLANSEAYNGRPPDRSIKDFLIQSSVIA